MANLDNIKNFRFWCQPILPLVYDDSLSYYEALCKFNTKLNEIIDRINNFQEDIEDMVDNKINVLKNYVDSENAKQNEDVKNQFDSVYDKINEVIVSINNNIETIYRYIANLNTITKNYIDVQISELKKLIDDTILGDIIIFNPTKGVKDNLNNVINDIYNALRYFGISCYQFDSKHLSCDEFDKLLMTALEFDTNSLEIIGNYYPHLIFNPVNGRYERLQDVLYMWFQEYRVDAIDCTGFDEKQLTVENVQQLDITALEFDEHARDKLP